MTRSQSIYLPAVVVALFASMAVPVLDTNHLLHVATSCLIVVAVLRGVGGTVIVAVGVTLLIGHYKEFTDPIYDLTDMIANIIGIYAGVLLGGRL